MWDSRAGTETAPPSATTAGAVIAQNAALAHGVAWVVAATASPWGWDAICCSQFAGVARWTWPHKSGRPTGNIWPLSRSVATSLTSESLMRPQYTTIPCPTVLMLAQAAAPCDMHSDHSGAPTHTHAAHLGALVAQPSGQACHQDASGLGCAAGSTCPTGSPATEVWAKVSVGLCAASRTGVLGPSTTFVSHLAPPLSPPPQA